MSPATRTLVLFLALSVASLAIMILIDRALGAKAEFLNAWSVVERLIGRVPVAGDSDLYRRLGAAGELAAVLLANGAVGALLTALLRRWLVR